MPILSHMTMAGWQSERAQLRVSLAALLLLVAQIAVFAHFIGHAAQGDNVDCTICLHAGQSGSALPPSAIPQIAFQAITSELVAAVDTRILSTYPAVYRSRAPPVSI